jgi:hypothetical protein
MRISVVLFALAFVTSTLGGCDALTSPEKLVQQDDAFCQSLGKLPRTKEYDRCRVNREETRERRQAERSNMVATGLAIGASPPPTSAPGH